MFQFTRPRGARLPLPAILPTDRISFNSRAREGRDQVGAVIFFSIGVSIHAPARGATQNLMPSPGTPAVSIHAPARGATAQVSDTPPELSFQFTRPRGARRDKERPDDLDQAFQFTRPRGARQDFRKIPRVFGVSIHAPARGATFCAQSDWISSMVSIHAPARGATYKAANLGDRQSFNSRAREGRD